MDMFPITPIADKFPTTYVSKFIATTHVETVVLLSREKADDYVRISVCTKDLKVTKES